MSGRSGLILKKLLIMKKMKFSADWIKLVRCCISSPVFSVLVNGSPRGFFKSERSLRQGHSISPFLLIIIIMEILSLILKRLRSHNYFQGFFMNEYDKTGEITHLLFADDALLFCQAEDSQVIYLLAALVCFELHKSMVYPIGSFDSYKYQLVDWNVVKQPLEYVGLDIPEIRSVNLALLCKWSWRFSTERAAWWRIMISLKYVNEESEWSMKWDLGSRGFSIWKSITDASSTFWKVGYLEPGRGGHDTSFWGDVWMNGMRLCELFPRVRTAAALPNPKIFYCVSCVDRNLWNIDLRITLRGGAERERQQLVESLAGIQPPGIGPSRVCGHSPAMEISQFPPAIDGSWIRTFCQQAARDGTSFGEASHLQRRRSSFGLFFMKPFSLMTPFNLEDGKLPANALSAMLIWKLIFLHCRFAHKIWSHFRKTKCITTATPATTGDGVCLWNEIISTLPNYGFSKLIPRKL